MNYEELLNIPYKSRKMFIILAILFLVSIIIVINVTIYDVYNTMAYYQDGSLTLNVPINYSDTILNGEYFKTDKEKYDIEVLYVSDILVDPSSMLNYQEIVLASSQVYPENLVVNISIYYNKEKVIEKLKKLL